jgi:hypothetical protein
VTRYYLAFAATLLLSSIGCGGAPTVEAPPAEAVEEAETAKMDDMMNMMIQQGSTTAGPEGGLEKPVSRDAPPEGTVPGGGEVEVPAEKDKSKG